MMTPPPTGTSAFFTEFPAAAPPPEPPVPVVAPPPPLLVDPPLPIEPSPAVVASVHAARPSPASVRPMPAAKRLRRGTSGNIEPPGWLTLQPYGEQCGRPSLAHNSQPNVGNPQEGPRSVVAATLGDCGRSGDVQTEGGVHPHRRRRCLLYTSPSPRDGLLSRMP